MRCHRTRGDRSGIVRDCAGTRQCSVIRGSVFIFSVFQSSVFHRIARISDTVVTSGFRSGDGWLKSAVPRSFLDDLWLRWCRVSQLGLSEADVNVGLLRHVPNRGNYL